MRPFFEMCEKSNKHHERQNERASGFHEALTGMPLFPLAGLNWRSRSVPLPSHTNPGFEITHLLSGRVCWRVEGGPTLRLAGGDMAITQPDVPHRGELEIIEPCKLFWFVTNPTAPGAARFTPFEHADLRSLERTFLNAGNCVVRAAKELRDIHLRMGELLRDQDGTATADLHVPRIRSLLVRGLLAAADSFHASSDHPKTHPLVDVARSWLEHHFESQETGIGKLCATMGYSPSHLLALFKKHLGQTPSDYLQRLRIDKALILLATTDLPIGEISSQLGFPSSQYFADRFRRFTGLSPHGYRERARHASRMPDRRT